jgi:TP901 family phage tail tape measure protein
MTEGQKEASAAIGLSAEGMAKQDRAVGRLASTIERNKRELQTGARAYHDYGSAARSATTSVRSLDRGGKTLGGSIPAIGVGLAALAAGFWAVERAVSGTLSAFSSFEDGLTEIRKTADLSADDLAQIADSIDSISTSSQGVKISTRTLLDLAAAAGQVGVRGVDDLTKYAVAMGKLGTASNLVGPEAVKTVTRILNVQGEGAENVDEFTAALVALGSAAAADEAEITRVANEVALSTSTFELGSVAVLGWATAMKESGVQAQLGGSVIGRALRAIQGAVSEGSEELDNFAAVAGMAVDDFAALFQQDPSAGLVAFLEGLNRTGRDSGGVLAKLGLSGEEVAKVLPVLAKNVDNLKSRLALAAEEAAKGTALNREAAAAFDTLSADMQLAENVYQLMARTIGEQLAPVIREVITNFALWAAENRDLIRDLGVDLADALRMVVTAGKAVVTVLEFLAENSHLVKGAVAGLIALNVVSWAQKFGTAVQLAVGSLDGMTKSAGLANSATVKLAGMGINPLTLAIGLLVTAFAAAQSAINDWKRDLDAAMAENVRAGERMREVMRQARDETNELLDSAQAAVEAQKRIAKEGIDPSSERARTIVVEEQTKAHERRVEALFRNKEALAELRKEEEATSKALSEQQEIVAKLIEDRDAAKAEAVTARASKQIAAMNKAIREARDEETRRSTAHKEAATAAAFMKKSVDRLTESTEAFSEETQQANKHTEDQSDILKRLADEERAAAQASRELEMAQRLTAEALMATATESKAAAEQLKDDLGRSMIDISRTMRDVLGPQMSKGQRAIDDWRKSLAKATEAIAEQREKIRKSIQDQVAAAAASVKLAKTDAERQKIADDLGKALGSLADDLRANKKAEEDLADARSSSARVEKELGEEDRQRVAFIISEIASLERLADVTLQGRDAVQQLTDEQDIAEKRARVFNSVMEATGGDLAQATLIADKYADALRGVAESESEVAENAERMRSVHEVLNQVADGLARIDTGSERANQAFQAFAQGVNAYTQARQAGATRGQAVGAGITAAGPAILQAAGVGVQTTSRFGGRGEGNFAVEGATIGAAFGPWGLVIGAIVGSFIKKGADDMKAQVVQSMGEGKITITEAEGALAEIAPQIQEAFSAFFNSMEDQLGAEIDETIGSLRITIREDRVRVMIGDINKVFNNLDEALAFGFAQILAANSHIAGLGNTTRQLFESLANWTGAIDLESLQRVIALTREIDLAAMGVGPEAASAYGMLAERLRDNVALAKQYRISLAVVYEHNARLIQQAKEQVQATRSSFLGTSSNLAAVREVTGALIAHNHMLRQQREAFESQIETLESQQQMLERVNELRQKEAEGIALTADEIEELQRLTMRASDVLEGLAAKMDEIADSGADTEAIIGGIGRDGGRVGGALEDVSGKLDNLNDKLGETREGLAALGDEFAESEIVELWRVAGAQAAESIIDMIRLVRGEQFGQDAMRAAAQIQYVAALADQIRITEQLLAATEVLDAATRGMLEGLIDEARKVLSDVAAGRVTIPTGGGRDTGAAARRREREEERRNIIELFMTTREAVNGVTEAMFAMRDRLDEITAIAERAEQLGIAADAVGRFVENALRMEEQDFMAPFLENVRRASETEFETRRRLIEEERQAAIDQARVLAEAQAAAGMGSFEDIFASLSATINESFDIDLAEVLADETEARRQAEEATNDATEAEADLARQREEARAQIEKEIGQLLDTARQVSPRIIALQRIGEQFARMREEAQAAGFSAEELEQHLRNLDEAEQGMIRQESIGLLQDYAGWIESLGLAMDPEAAQILSRAQFELARAQFLAAFSTGELRDQLEGLGVDVGKLIQNISEMSFDDLVPGPGGRQVPEGRIYRGPVIDRTAQRPGGQQQQEDPLVALREELARLLDSWTQVQDPVIRDLMEVNRQVQDLTDRWVEAGGAVEDLAELEAAAANRRRQILTDHFQQLQDRLDEIRSTDPRVSPVEAFQAGFAELQDIAAAVRGGEIGRLGEVIDLERRLRQEVADIFDSNIGAGSVWQDRLTSILESLQMGGDAFAGVNLEDLAANGADDQISMLNDFLSRQSSQGDQAAQLYSQMVDIQQSERDILAAVRDELAEHTRIMQTEAASLRKIQELTVGQTSADSRNTQQMTGSITQQGTRVTSAIESAEASNIVQTQQIGQKLDTLTSAVVTSTEKP